MTEVDPSWPAPDAPTAVMLAPASAGRGLPDWIAPTVAAVMAVMSSVVFFWVVRFIAVVFRALEKGFLVPWLFTKPTGVPHFGPLLIVVVSLLAAGAAYALTAARSDRV